MNFAMKIKCSLILGKNANCKPFTKYPLGVWLFMFSSRVKSGKQINLVGFVHLTPMEVEGKDHCALFGAAAGRSRFVFPFLLSKKTNKKSQNLRKRHKKNRCSRRFQIQTSGERQAL